MVFSYLAGLGLAVLVKRIFANAPRPLPPLPGAVAKEAKEKEKENEGETGKGKEASAKTESKQQEKQPAPADAANDVQKVSVVPPSGVIGLGVDGSLFRYHPRLYAIRTHLLMHCLIH